jgi:hypothetical protein
MVPLCHHCTPPLAGISTYRRNNQRRYDGLQQQQADGIEKARPPRRPPLDAGFVEQDPLKTDGLHHLQQASVKKVTPLAVNSECLVDRLK